MTSIRAPGLGPIVGHTTHDSARLWIRAGDPGDQSSRLASERRTIGIIGIVDLRTNAVGDAWYFRLHREFDRTGTFTLGRDVQMGAHEIDFERARRAGVSLSGTPQQPMPLQPDTTYTVRLGTLTIDDPMPDDESLPDFELARRLPNIDAIKHELLGLDRNESEASFQTFPSPDAQPTGLSFIFGSCRYPGILWKVKEADRIYAAMLRHVTSTDFGDPARFVIMGGDQVYADMLNRFVPILRADTYEEFQTRYHEAFGASNLRRLMCSAPSYMILDDHEIEDNWTQDRINEFGKQHLFNIAVNAYMSYQWSHSPRTWGRLLYYTFECGYPFFVLDTRTQRFVDDAVGLRDNHLLGRPAIDPLHPGQLKRLLEWLTAQQVEKGNAPKFVVTASVFAPNPMDERIDPATLDGSQTAERLLFEANARRRDKSDSWPAFPLTRSAILRHIIENRIQNVVFLSGDIHCANVAELQFVGDADAAGLKTFSVTSSAFYWPFPFADGDPNGFVHDSRAEGQHDPFPVLGTSAVMHYRAYGFTQEDNFCRIDVDRDHHVLNVRVFDREGRVVQVSDAAGAQTSVNSLPLEPW